MDIKKYVSELDMKADSYRGNCPVCKGRNTFTVTNVSGVYMYNCYMVGCIVSGGLRAGLSAKEIKSKMKNVDEYIDYNFTLPTSIVPIKNVEYIDDNDYHIFALAFCNRWNIDPKDVLYDIRENRVVFLIHNTDISTKQLVDAVGRSTVDCNRMKWKRYGNGTLPYHIGSHKTCVLVEDSISAYVVNKQLNIAGVALLGTQLTDAHKNFLTRYDKVIVALDRDAVEKQMKIAKEVKSFVGEVKVLRTMDDLKYAVPEDIEKLRRFVWN